MGMLKEKFSAFVEHYVLQLESPDGRTRKMQDDLDQAITVPGEDEEDPIFGTNCGRKTMMDTTVEELKGDMSDDFGQESRHSFLDW